VPHQVYWNYWYGLLAKIIAHPCPINILWEFLFFATKHCCYISNTLIFLLSYFYNHYGLPRFSMPTFLILHISPTPEQP
jgi:hypothetical protein